MKKEQYIIHAKLGINHWWHYGTKSFFNKMIRKTMTKGSIILDAGCGVGDMINLLRNDYTMYGLDSSQDALDFCSQKNLTENLILGDANKLPFNANSFDAVISLDVLYHKWIRDDLHALKEIHRVLKPSGKVFIQVPAYNWLKSSHDEWAFSDRRYTAGSLSELLRAAGFVEKKISYRVSILFPFAVMRRLIVRHQGSDMNEFNPILNFMFKKIIWFENHLVLNCNLPFGLSVVGIAEK